MSKISYIIFFGVLVFLVPFTAFPSSWKFIFNVVAGLLIAILGTLCRKETRAIEVKKETLLPISAGTFVENNRLTENN